MKLYNEVVNLTTAEKVKALKVVVNDLKRLESQVTDSYKGEFSEIIRSLDSGLEYLSNDISSIESLAGSLFLEVNSEKDQDKIMEIKVNRDEEMKGNEMLEYKYIHTVSIEK